MKVRYQDGSVWSYTQEGPPEKLEDYDGPVDIESSEEGPTNHSMPREAPIY